MKWGYYCLWMLLFHSCVVDHSNEVDSLFHYLKTHAFEEAKKELGELNPTPLQRLFAYEIKYLERNEHDPELLYPLSSTPKNKRVAIYNRYLHGTYLSSCKRPNKKKALVHYTHALKEAEKIQDTVLIQKILKEICFDLLQNELISHSIHFYNNKINLYKQDSIDVFWNRYFKLSIQLKKASIEKKKPSFNVDEAFENLYRLTENPYARSLTFHRQGMYEDVFNQALPLAGNYFKEAILALKGKPEHIFLKRKHISTISYATILNKQEKYVESIRLLKKIDFENPIHNNKREKVYVYNLLADNYKALSIKDSSIHYYEKMNLEKDELYHLEYAIESKSIESESKRMESTEINNLTKKNTYLSKFIGIVLPVAGGLLFLTLIVFWFYKKVDEKKNFLEQEKENTLKEVQNLKQLVVKNHIILKDRTKVYINDLLYVKAEDHYIRVYTSDGKNHLVRGKLSELENQLPPNFIRTHRSYITNRNYVKQLQSTFLTITDGAKIPISRNFKKNNI